MITRSKLVPYWTGRVTFQKEVLHLILYNLGTFLIAVFVFSSILARFESEKKQMWSQCSKVNRIRLNLMRSQAILTQVGPGANGPTGFAFWLCQANWSGRRS